MALSVTDDVLLLVKALEPLTFKMALAPSVAVVVLVVNALVERIFKVPLATLSVSKVFPAEAMSNVPEPVTFNTAEPVMVPPNVKVLPPST